MSLISFKLTFSRFSKRGCKFMTSILCFFFFLNIMDNISNSLVFPGFRCAITATAKCQQVTFK